MLEQLALYASVTDNKEDGKTVDKDHCFYVSGPDGTLSRQSA
jgi:hypothetical protein